MSRVLFVYEEGAAIEDLRRLLADERIDIAETRDDENIEAVCLRHRPAVLVIKAGPVFSRSLDLCRWLRDHPFMGGTPAIFLFEDVTEIERTVLLELGASDCIALDGAVHDVLARIRFHLRKTPAVLPVVQCGGLEIDRARCRVRLDGRPIHLTPGELRLLVVLATHVGFALTYRELLVLASFSTREALKLRVARLRRKLGDDPARPQMIRSVRGLGYRLDLPDVGTL